MIAPIGEPGSKTRDRSDKVLRHIIRPAATECGFTATRADELSSPGLITTDVLRRIVDNPLVIADLTERNPNVFYELSLRHALGKPVIHIIDESESIPFDLSMVRMIRVNHQDLDSSSNAREAIIKQIREIEKHPEHFETPISLVAELRLLDKSDKPTDRDLSRIVAMLETFASGLTILTEDVNRRRTYHDTLHETVFRLQAQVDAVDPR